MITHPSMLILDFISLIVGVWVSYSCYKDGLKATSLAFAVLSVLEAVILAFKLIGSQ